MQLRDITNHRRSMMIFRSRNLTIAYTWIVLTLGILCSVTLQHKIPKVKTTSDASR